MRVTSYVSSTTVQSTPVLSTVVLSTQRFYHFYLLLFTALLLNFDLPRFFMPLLKYSFKEHPLTSYDAQTPKSKFLLFLKAFLYET